MININLHFYEFIYMCVSVGPDNGEHKCFCFYEFIYNIYMHTQTHKCIYIYIYIYIGGNNDEQKCMFS